MKCNIQCINKKQMDPILKQFENWVLVKLVSFLLNLTLGG